MNTRGSTDGPTDGTFADFVKRRRKALGLTQIALADAAGVTLRTVQFWERGEREPGRIALRGLAQALHCPAARLLDGEGAP